VLGKSTLAITDRRIEEKEQRDQKNKIYTRDIHRRVTTRARVGGMKVQRQEYVSAAFAPLACVASSKRKLSRKVRERNGGRSADSHGQRRRGERRKICAYNSYEKGQDRVIRAPPAKGHAECERTTTTHSSSWPKKTRLRQDNNRVRCQARKKKH